MVEGRDKATGTAAQAGTDPLRIEREGDVAIWRISRPQARNALNYATFTALEHAIGSVKADPGLRAVVLTADGATFASGGDLRELRTATTRAQATHLAELGRVVCDGIAELDVPVIAALPGPAIGGGAELAVACDMRVADPDATLCFKHARMAVTTAWGVLPKLVTLVGHGTASRLLLTSQEIDAREALRIGLVDAVSERGECVATAVAWGLDIAQGAPMAVAQLKGLLRTGLSMLDEQRLLERERFVSTWTSEDHREAVEAFFASRPPKWHGR